jgi:di/tricarboxylate transporter
MAFSSHFGGLLTIIGTPTNLIVSALRVEHMNIPFGMFEFAPVGLAISIIGVLFIALVGWRLIPRQRTGAADRNGFELADYVTEVRVTKQSELAGRRLHNLKSLTKADIWIVSIERDGEYISSPSGSQKIMSGDVLLVRAETTDLREFLYDVQAELQDAKPISHEKGQTDDPTNAWEQLKSQFQSRDDIETVEVIVSPGSTTVNHTARELDLRARYGLNLLAVSRSDENVRSSVGSTHLKPNDILLIQAFHEDLPATLDALGWIPLAEREIQLQPRNTILGVVIFVTALSLATMNILPVPVAMIAGAVAMIVSGLLSVHEAYRNIEWPILVLLGAMLSMGAALERSGGDALIADQILLSSRFLSPVALLFLVMLVTMLLSDVVNNAAAVVLMSSIAISVARGLGVSTDPFLVAVAIGGAFAFLTPIGHEANVLVFEAGGYEFGDYWRLGLPLELLITTVAVPLVLLLWPL